MHLNIWRILSLVVITALSACGGGGSAVQAPVIPQPGGNSPSGSAFAASNVQIHEIPFSLNWNRSVDYTVATAIAVSPAGAVYFGEGGGQGGTLLYSYSNGVFAQTQPAYNWCTSNVTICCGQTGPCSGNGVTSIDAQNADPNKVFWGGETAIEGVPDGLIFMGANGVKATAPPAPYNSMQPVNATFFLSLVTDKNGTLWDAGGGGYGAFGYPANISSLPCDSTTSTNCWDALWLTNGPNNHVWGYMHVEQSTARYGWPIQPSQATGSIVVEFDTSGAVLHSYSVNGFIGGLQGGADGAVWFTNQTANSIGRISGSGAYTQYAIPSSGSGAGAITMAADGALWFTEPNVNKVARIDTSGNVVEFTLPTANSNPVAIAADPAGGPCSPDVIWVLEANAAQLAKISY